MKASGFQGDRAAYIQHLRTDPKYYPKTPDELIEGTAADFAATIDQFDGANIKDNLIDWLNGGGWSLWETECNAVGLDPIDVADRVWETILDDMDGVPWPDPVYAAGYAYAAGYPE